MSGARDVLLSLYRAAIAGAEVESLTADAVASVPLDRRHRVWLFAIGKAAHPMARAAVSTLHRALAEICGGVVISPDASPAPLGTLTAVVGDHPVPGRRSFAAARALRHVVTAKRGADLGIVLLSGGASSLIGRPLRGFEETEYTELCQLLLGSGLDIAAMNAVRKRFSYWAAGRMALGLAPARTFCFAVSDVPGDDLAAIGSGPCVPDPATAREVTELLRRAELHHRMAPAFREYLADVGRGAVPETPKPTHPAFAHVTARVIANNSAALAAVRSTANEAGLQAVIQHQALTGDASAMGERLAATLITERARSGGSRRCLLWGGETTVVLPPDAPRGGRCQALALAAARVLGEAGDAARGISLLAAGTDGRDGTTDAAGAIVDGATWARITAAGIDPRQAMRAHDAHRALHAAGALFTTGATGTNVMDVAIGVIDHA